MSDEITLYRVYTDSRGPHLSSCKFVKEQKGLFVIWKNTTWPWNKSRWPRQLERPYFWGCEAIESKDKAWDEWVEGAAGEQRRAARDIELAIEREKKLAHFLSLAEKRRKKTLK